MKQLPFNFAITVCLWSCMSLPLVAAAQPQNSKPSDVDFSIFGLSISDADLQQFLSKLGPAIPFTSESNSDLKCICFISNRDETLVLLRFKGNHYAGFKLMSQKRQFYKWHFCEPSGQVSKSIVIDNRLKLGLNKDQVKAIFGTPQLETEEVIKYVFRWQVPSNIGDSEDEYPSDNAVQSDSGHLTTVTCETIFLEDKLISLDVLKYPE